MKKVLGIPNGSLEKPTIELLKKIDLRMDIDGRKFESMVEGFGMFNRVIKMRPQDIPGAIVDGMIDVGITGLDQVYESGQKNELKVITELNYSKKLKKPVRVVLFSKKGNFIDEDGVLVASEYPYLTKQFFKKATIRFSHGGTEQKVAYGKYDYGVCVTETGESLRKNGLIIVKTFLTSPTVLIAKKETPDLKHFGRLMAGGLNAEKYSLLKMNVTEINIAIILETLPAITAPTINKLSSGDYAIETVVFLDEIGNLIVGLMKNEASGILVQNVEVVI